MAGLVEAADARRSRARRDPQARLRARAALPGRARGGRADDQTHRARWLDRGRWRLDSVLPPPRRSTAMAAGRGRHLSGDVLRRDVARPRRLPAPRRRRRPAVGLGRLPLRGRGHQAGPPRQGERGAPDLLVCRPARARSRACGPSGCTSRSAGRARTVERLRVDDYMAYYRGARDRFLAAVSDGRPVAYPPPETYPEPVDHCDVCRWAAECVQRRRDDDHLSLVAGISARQRRALGERGIATLEALGDLELPMTPRLDGTSEGALDPGPGAGADPAGGSPPTPDALRAAVAAAGRAVRGRARSRLAAAAVAR